MGIFMTASLIISITASLGIYLYLEKLKKTLLFILIFDNIPYYSPLTYSVFEHLKTDYLSGFHGVSSAELKAYDFLKNNTDKDSRILLINQEKYVLYASIANDLAQRDLYLSGEGVSQLKTKEIIEREERVNIYNILKMAQWQDHCFREVLLSMLHI